MSVVAVIFMFVYYVLPQYFGIATPFFDFTAQRMAIIILLFFLIEKRERILSYYTCLKKSPFLIWVLLYLFVLLYTAIIRADLGTFMYSFIELIALFLVVYIVKDCLGIKNFVKLIRILGLVLCILGIAEYIIGYTPFRALVTIPNLYTGAFVRSGQYRIMGPANHSLGYGLILVTYLPFACLDRETLELDIFANPVHFVLAFLNIFLTGARSTLAVCGVEILLFFLFSTVKKKKKTVIIGVLFLVLLALIVLCTWGTALSRYIMMQLTSVFDEIFGTSVSVNFGAQISRLQNSATYRTYLPKLFTVDWLSPLLGMGSDFKFAWYIDGRVITSVDNAYVCFYIKYAYSGLILFCLYHFAVTIKALKDGVKTKSGLLVAMACGMGCYFLNLWWVDTLMTIKYVYILFAVCFAVFETKKDEKTL